MGYCTQCGSKMVKESLNSFNPITGKRNYWEICSIAPCEHDGHDYKEIKETGFLAFFRDTKYCCKRCGKEIRWSP